MVLKSIAGGTRWNVFICTLFFIVENLKTMALIIKFPLEDYVTLTQVQKNKMIIAVREVVQNTICDVVGNDTFDVNEVHIDVNIVVEATVSNTETLLNDNE